MVLFRIIRNLLRLAIGLPMRVLWLPIHLITHNFFLFIILIAAIFIFMSGRDSGKPSSKAPPIAAPKQAKNRGDGPIVIDTITKTEDGDSSFATDVYAIMSDEERATYSQNYYYAMTNLPDGQTHSWSSYNIAGSIRPNDTFANKTGERCRHFNEVLKVHHIQQTISGTACDNGGGSWCKLKPNAVPSCGLGGNKPGMMESIRKMF